MKKVKKKKKKAKAAKPKRSRGGRVIKGSVKVRERSPVSKKLLNRRARDIALDDEMLAQMILLWRYGITDDRIANILGIAYSTLKKWLQDNRPVEVLVLDRPDKNYSRKVTIGLKDLREHEKSNLKASYLQRLEGIIAEAKSEGDFKTAGTNLKWLMERMLPNIFGDPRIRPEGDPDKPKRVGFPLRPPTLD